MRKVWFGVAAVYFAMAIMALAVISHVDATREEVIGLRGQITALTERLSIDKPTMDVGDPVASQRKILYVGEILYVQEGAIKVPVRVDGVEIDPELRFHKIYFDSTLGHYVGTFGAVSYILDSSGRKVSGKFHEFFIRDSQLWGSLGATERQVILKN